MTAHISFLLWELDIWQTRSWQIYPHIKWQFYRFLLYSESSYLADQVLAHLPPIKYWFHRRLFIGSHAAPADHLTLHLHIYHLIKHWFHRWLCMGSHAAPADHLKLCLQIYPAIKHWFHRWLCMGSHTAPADLPLEWQFHRFLLWQLIFHSYSESSSCGIPGPGSSTPIQWWFHRFLWNSYFIPTLRAYHLADQVLADLPQFNSNCAHIWQTKCWQI